jgi:hypothetical protein
MKIYATKQSVIKALRDELKLNPISFGSILIDTIFRRYDKKTIHNNYIEIYFTDLSGDQNHSGTLNTHIQVTFVCFAKNEIMVERVGNALKSKARTITSSTGDTIQNLRHFGDIERVDTNKYLKMLIGDIYLKCT